MDAKDLSLEEFVDLMCQEKDFKLSSHHKKMLDQLERQKKGERVVILQPRLRYGKNFILEAAKEYYGKH